MQQKTNAEIFPNFDEYLFLEVVFGVNKSALFL